MAQETILEKFTATEVNDEIVLNWTIEQGSTCNGIDIRRSGDSLNFELIGNIEGICGDEKKPVSYTFVDENPLRNQINYYRLELGSVGSSDIISIKYIDLGDEGYSVIPNPFFDESKVYFENSNNESHELNIYNIEGKILKKDKSDDAYFTLIRNQMNAGMYIFTIENLESDQLKTGKFIILN